MSEFGLHSKRILIDGALVEATLLLSEGKISKVLPGPLEKHSCPVEDLGDLVVMPGLIDPHVHINEPGREDWEGFDTATKAAAAGGFTTLVEMPLNSAPVTTTVAAFRQKLAATKDKLHVNCGFWGGIVPDNINDLDELLESGVFGIKAFLTHSGIDDFPNVSEENLRAGMSVIRKHELPLLVHAELSTEHDGQLELAKSPSSYSAYLNSRPKEWEDTAIKMMIDLCREFGTQTHIVHLSSADSIEQLNHSKTEGLPISVETCPHYLYFDAEDIPDGRTEYKCAPPIREKKNNESLWKALEEGLFSFITSDHSPAPPEMKEMETGNLLKAWGGISSLQFSLPAFWTKAKERGISIEHTCELMSTNAAEFLGLESRKGRLEAGHDADVMVWDPEATFEVTKDLIEFKHKVTPYTGEWLFGKVHQTYVGGEKVFDNGAFRALNCGKVLMRNER